MNPRQRAHRILKRRDRYRDLTARPRPEWLEEVVLKDDVLLGIYENAPTCQDQVIVTEQALYAPVEGTWTRIPYREIDGTYVASEHGELEGRDKSIAVRIMVLTGGREIAVPMKGRQGRFRDVFEFSRFLRAYPKR